MQGPDNSEEGRTSATAYPHAARFGPCHADGGGGGAICGHRVNDFADPDLVFVRVSHASGSGRHYEWSMRRVGARTEFG